MTTNGIVQKIWNFCHTLRDEGGDYEDYLFAVLKMAHEYSRPPYNRDTNISEEYNWESLIKGEVPNWNRIM